MTQTVSPTCDKCNEPLRGHTQPFTTERRPCDVARLYRDTPDPMFCRYPAVCSKEKKCQSIAKYDRACDD